MDILLVKYYNISDRAATNPGSILIKFDFYRVLAVRVSRDVFYGIKVHV